MAGMSNYAPPMPAEQAPPPLTAVISQQYCMGYNVEMTIIRKMMTLSEGNFTVMDVNGTIMFKIKGKLFSLHDRRTLLDGAGIPLITFHQKLMSAHRKWYAFRGESTDSKDLLFSVKKSSLFQFKTKLDVFLASNPTKEEVPDFRIEGSYMESACAIYAGTSNIKLAQMHRNYSMKSVLLGKDNFGVTVYPNVDYAFIVALVVILEEINMDRSGAD